MPHSRRRGRWGLCGCGGGGGGAKPAAKRFSLLLLEEGEGYLGDALGACRPPPGALLGASGGGGSGAGAPPAPPAELLGRVRVGSFSLVFEPDDARWPVIRLPLREVREMEAGVGGDRGFVVSTGECTQMKANGQDVPYVTTRGAFARWQFRLSYTPLTEFLPMLHEALATSRMDSLWERQALVRAAAAAAMGAQRFDPGHLVDLGERIVADLRATQLTPLVQEPGRLVLTDRRIYFQPLHDIFGDCPVRSHSLGKVAAVARRRHLLRPTALECFFVESPRGGWGGPSALFAFQSAQDCEAMLEAIRQQPALGSAAGSGRGGTEAAGSLLEADGAWLKRVTLCWQQGALSNFDYLLYLNLAAGRSFNDLTQWPVYPWVLADYSSTALNLESPATFRDLSKPVGALNEQRVGLLRERLKHMPEDDPDFPRFLYGTHYSTPGYVMYWLVRTAPGLLLRLQSGRFDDPDRMFYSIPESWAGVTSTAPDVKELIPEFYLEDAANFLRNGHFLPLGRRHNSEPVDDVVLPPWASSPEDFVRKHREALESDYVSQHLHLWIDLIFGCKQRGEAALAADNLFHPMTYEGTVDIDQVDDPNERASFEAQMNEFGQTPSQIFTQPHPPRLTARRAEQSGGRVGSSSANSIVPSPGAGIRASKLKPETEGSSGRAATMSLLSALVVVTSPEASGGLAAQNSPQGAVPSPPGEVHRVDDLLGGGVVGREATEIPTKRGTPQDTLAGPGLDDLEEEDLRGPLLAEPVLFSRGPLVPQETLKAHGEGNGGVAAIAALAGHVYTVGADGMGKIIDGRKFAQVRQARLSDQPLTSLDIIGGVGGGLAFAGSFDSSVYAFGLNGPVGSFEAHDDAVTALRVGNGASGGPWLATASWDCCVRLWDLQTPHALFSPAGTGGGYSEASSKMLADFCDHDSPVWSLDAAPDGNSVFSGTESGVTYRWDPRAPGPAAWHAQVCQWGLVALQSLGADGEKLLVAASDGTLQLLDLRGGGSNSLASVNCGTIVKTAVVDRREAPANVLAACKDGSLVRWELESLNLHPPLVVNPCDSNSLCVAPALHWERAVLCGHDDGSLVCLA